MQSVTYFTPTYEPWGSLHYGDHELKGKVIFRIKDLQETATERGSRFHSLVKGHYICDDHDFFLQYKFAPGSAECPPRPPSTEVAALLGNDLFKLACVERNLTKLDHLARSMLTSLDVTSTEGTQNSCVPPKPFALPFHEWTGSLWRAYCKPCLPLCTDPLPNVDLPLLLQVHRYVRYGRGLQFLFLCEFDPDRNVTQDLVRISPQQGSVYLWLKYADLNSEPQYVSVFRAHGITPEALELTDQYYSLSRESIPDLEEVYEKLKIPLFSMLRLTEKPKRLVVTYTDLWDQYSQKMRVYSSSNLGAVTITDDDLKKKRRSSVEIEKDEAKAKEKAEHQLGLSDSPYPGKKPRYSGQTVHESDVLAGAPPPGAKILTDEDIQRDQIMKAAFDAQFLHTEIPAPPPELLFFTEADVINASRPITRELQGGLTFELTCDAIESFFKCLESRVVSSTNSVPPGVVSFEVSAMSVALAKTVKLVKKTAASVSRKTTGLT